MKFIATNPLTILPSPPPDPQLERERKFQQQTIADFLRSICSGLQVSRSLFDSGEPLGSYAEAMRSSDARLRKMH